MINEFVCGLFDLKFKFNAFFKKMIIILAQSSSNTSSPAV